MDCIPDLQPRETGKYHYIQFPKGKTAVTEITQQVCLVGEQTACPFVMVKVLCQDSMHTHAVVFLFKLSHSSLLKKNPNHIIVCERKVLMEWFKSNQYQSCLMLIAYN